MVHYNCQYFKHSVAHGTTSSRGAYCSYKSKFFSEIDGNHCDGCAICTHDINLFDIPNKEVSKPRRIDVTDKVSFGENDGEALPLTQCVCGKAYPLWDFIIGFEPTECEQCGRKLVFSVGITVYEIQE